MRKLIVVAGAIALVTIAVLDTLRGRGETPPHHRSVILITVDAYRANRLSCYGYTGQTTPNIDALAKRGTLFTQATTLPSFSSPLTSTYRWTHGVLKWGDTLDPEFPHPVAVAPESRGLYGLTFRARQSCV